MNRVPTDGITTFLWMLGAALSLLSACGREAAPAAGGAGEGAQAEAAAAPAPSEKRWFIAAANPYAAKAGADILKKGGSAVDAAIATQAVLGLVEPQSSGLGGGAFMIHYDPVAGTLETYNGRETAPASATPDRFLTADGAPMNFYDAVVGGLSVGVPGALRMLELAHQEHGKLAWADDFAAATALAEEGFKVSPRLNGLLERIPRLKQLPAAAAYFYDENGAPWPADHVLKNPAYAQTLKTIAENGADASPEPPSTSHFVIVDGDGKVISMTTTVEFAFGSHLMAAGMVLNNQLTDFSFLPVRDGKPVANAVAPGKRPRSSMTPAIVFDEHGEVWAAAGSPGGPAIIGYVAKTLIAMIDWGMSAQEAVNYPNAVYPRAAPILEQGGFDNQIVEGLKARGHAVSVAELNSGVHVFKRLPDGSWDGGADPRREGVWLTGVVAQE